MDEEQQARADLDREVPYTVIVSKPFIYFLHSNTTKLTSNKGSMSMSGIGPLLWWEDNQNTSMADAEAGAMA
jgi:hypothetical protein